MNYRTMSNLGWFVSYCVWAPVPVPGWFEAYCQKLVTEELPDADPE